MLAALRVNGPVVALESTIITHGMPYPHNLETARSVERIVRNQVIKFSELYFSIKLIFFSHFVKKAIPATIAVLKGRIKVGLTDDELTELATIASDIRSPSPHRVCVCFFKIYY